MKHYDLKLGMKCNNNCIHCVVANRRQSEDKEPDMTYADVLRVLKRLDFKELESIVITGGEPTTFPFLGRLLRYLYDNYPNLSVCLQTNGRFLSRFIDDFEYLYSKGSSMGIVIAIHANEEELHDMITNIPNSHSFKQTTDSIRAFRDRFGDKFSWRSETVLSNYNKHLMLEISEFVSGLGCHYIGFSYPHLDGFYEHNLDRTVEDIGFDYSDLETSLRNLTPFMHNHPEIEFMLEEFPPCLWYSLGLELPVNRNNIYLTCFDNKEDTVISFMGEDFTGFVDGYKDSHRHYEECSKCEYSESCTGIWYESYDTFENKIITAIPRQLDSKEK